MKIIIAGGTGTLGKILLKHWVDTNHEIVVLTRSSSREERNIRFVQWDAKSIGNWANEITGSDVMLNLVGRSVNCRYTSKNKAEIIRSRVDSTRAIGQAIQGSPSPPKLWMNAGSAAIFGNSGEEIKDEKSPLGEGFSPEVCKQWEKAFHEFETPKTRKVFLRIGVVLQHGEGLIKPFINMARVGLGGKMGTGRQYISWIHEKDFIKVIEFVIEDYEIKGILHCCSPHPVRNMDFMKSLRQALGIPFGLPNPAPFIHFGAVIIRTEGDLVLHGRRVVSQILKEKKFHYAYPEINETMKHLVK